MTNTPDSNESTNYLGMTTPLSPAGLCTIIRKTVDPEVGLKNEYDGLATLVNACMLSTDFKFVGLGEDGKIDSAISAESLAILPADWNASTSSSYAFRYTHQQSSMEFIMRITRLGKKTMIMGLATGDDKVQSIDIVTQDYTSENFYPWKPTADAEALANGYISLSRIKDFVSLFKINILQKLIPGLNKEGYTEERSSTSNESRSSRIGPGQEIPRPGYDPLRIPSRPNPRPSDWPPEFEDEHNMQNRGIRMPGAFGADDLNPPGIDTMNPFGRRGGHRGMHPTPEDIMFPDRGYGTPTFPSPNLPPAGARYDPVFPGDNAGQRRGHFGMDGDVGNSMFS